MEIESRIEATIKTLHWLGHDAFRIDSGSGAIYIDPYQINADTPKAAAILITHDHFDHFSPEDIAKIITPDTQVLAPPSVIEQMDHKQVRALRVGDEVEILPKVKVKAVPAYNLDKTFHPQSSQWLGFVLSLDEVTVYHAGDTDFIPEMLNQRVDIALLPVSGTYVMTADEAVQAALALQPKVAIPMHYGSLVGTSHDAIKFVESLQGKVKTALIDKE